MKYINTFNSMTDFNKDKETNLNQPRVALVKENGGGVDKLFYIKFKFYTYSNTSLINGSNGNSITNEDIPVKTTVEDIYNDETIRGQGFFYYKNIEGIRGIEYSNMINLSSHLTITPDSLDLIDNGRLVTKFTLTGLKRKDSDVRDFVGEIACYLTNDNNPILLRVNRTNPEHPTVDVLSKGHRDFNKYMDNHEPEKRTKGIQIHFDHL